MSEMLTFQPVAPTIAVQRIETLAQIKSVGAFLRENHALFVGLPSDFGFKSSAMRVTKVDASIPTNNSYAAPRVIFSKGDYLVTSTNGIRYFTSNPSVEDGDFTGFPAELFVPIRGAKVEFQQ